MSPSNEGERTLDVYPGRTSMIRTARGIMTLQTEISGSDPEVVTIIDYCGRVLQRTSEPLPPELVDEAEITRFANACHAAVESSVYESLAAAAARPRRRAADERRRLASWMFVRAMRAYAQQDLVSALALLHSSERLLPDDPRIVAALAVLEPS